jgi:hypothetical protein
VVIGQLLLAHLILHWCQNLYLLGRGFGLEFIWTRASELYLGWSLGLTLAKWEQETGLSLVGTSRVLLLSLPRMKYFAIHVLIIIFQTGYLFRIAEQLSALEDDIGCGIADGSMNVFTWTVDNYCKCGFHELD